ncbi:MAG: ABC transporter permease [Cohnella sp.]|uniref:carbohydrate ABC transporter permease n=1 Tax=Cohnella sp. TaxID=1883426 RepID=UPI000E37A68C|nr:carbohydrate ABC transporter permease [Cohnella sp.]REK65654.1 MAG: ABC transporter permease [Cohnella sp.]
MASFHGNKIDPSRYSLGQVKFFVFLIPLGIVMILPIVFMFSQAFKPLDELFLFPPTFIVRNPTFENLVRLLSLKDMTVIPVTKYLFNSVVVSAVVVALSLMTSAMTGYALSKKKFRLRNVLFEINTIALMFVPAAVTIPRYLVAEKLGLINSYWGHILPLLALPVGVFLIKQFVDQIPNELIEAAAIDGAKDAVVFTRVVLPLIRPALATVAILAFQTVWNNAETSSLYMSKETLKTFAFYMTTLSTTVGNNVAGQGVAAAAALIMFIPNLIIFIFMQSKVMDTMAHSGLK